MVKTLPEILFTLNQADGEVLAHSCSQQVINSSLMVPFGSCFVLSSFFYSSEEEFNKALNNLWHSEASAT